MEEINENKKNKDRNLNDRNNSDENISDKISDESKISDSELKNIRSLINKNSENYFYVFYIDF